MGGGGWISNDSVCTFFLVTAFSEQKFLGYVTVAVDSVILYLLCQDLGLSDALNMCLSVFKVSVACSTLLTAVCVSDLSFFSFASGYLWHRIHEYASRIWQSCPVQSPDQL